MTLGQFVTKYLGKQVEYHSYSSGAENQCVDLVNQYIFEVLGLTPIIGTHAKDFPKKYNSAEFEYIKNTPEFIPERGDIVVWNGRAGGGYGHIAIILEANISTFNSLDQNWSKKERVTIESHNYTNVSGFLRPKKGTTMPEKPTEDVQVFLDKWGVKSLDEASMMITKELGFLADARKRVASVEKQIKELQDQLATADGSIHTLSSELETKDKQIAAYKGEVTKKETEIAKLQAQLGENKPILQGKRKMLVALLTPIVAVIAKIMLDQFQIEVDPQTILYLIMAGMAYIGVEGAKDFAETVRSAPDSQK